MAFNEKVLELGPQRSKEPPSSSISMDEAGALTQGNLSSHLKVPMCSLARVAQLAGYHPLHQKVASSIHGRGCVGGS